MRNTVPVQTIRRIAAIVATEAGCLYGFACMKRRLPIVLALTVALAFAASGGPRHARAAAHDHGQAAAQSHTHDASASGHSHAATDGDFAEGGNHDHAGTPATDQGCCYAWCTSVAVIHAAEWALPAAVHDTPPAFEKPFWIAALSRGIDPPPR